MEENLHVGDRWIIVVDAKPAATMSSATSCASPSVNKPVQLRTDLYPYWPCLLSLHVCPSIGMQFCIPPNVE